MIYLRCYLPGRSLCFLDVKYPKHTESISWETSSTLLKKHYCVPPFARLEEALYGVLFAGTSQEASLPADVGEGGRGCAGKV